MINDLTDLNALLGHYDPGKALVGPLLSLPISSSFRFFHIAGNGAKVYHSIGLGFIEAETEAERQRGDIVAKLRSRFSEVKVLGSQLEMAREADALWPTEETARFLATAGLEAKLQPTHNGTRDKAPSSDMGMLPSNQCKPAVPPSRHAALEQDDLALAVLRLKSPPETAANTETTTATVAHAETSADRSVKESGRSASIIYRLCAVSGAAALIAGIVVTGTRHFAKEASQGSGIAQVGAVEGANDRSQTTGSVIPSSQPNQIATAEKAVLQPPAQAAETVRSQAPPVVNSQSAPSPAVGARALPDTDELLSRAPEAVRPQITAPSQSASAQIDTPPVSEPQTPHVAFLPLPQGVPQPTGAKGITVESKVEPEITNSTCFASASAVRQDHPDAWPSWTLRALGHEGTKCWYPTTRTLAHDHHPT